MEDIMEQEELSLKDLYQIVKKHFFTMVIATILGVLASVLVMMFFITPKYSSEAQLLVSQQQDGNQSQVLTSEIQGNVLLINTYQDIIKGYSTLSKVNENLGTNYSIDVLESAIDVSQSTNSQAFNIAVKMESAEEAQSILNELINVFEGTIQGVPAFNSASTLILSPASYNPNRISPSLTLYVLLGAILGLMVSLVIILIVELMDTTIKDEEYLTKLGIINLGRVYELSTKELKQTRLINNENQNRLRERV